MKHFPVWCLIFVLLNAVIDQLLIRCSVYVRYWRKSGSIMGQYISYL